MNLFKEHIKYINEEAVWRGDSIVNTSYHFVTGSFPWGTNTPLLQGNDLTVSSSLILQCKLIRSSFLFLNTLLTAFVKGNYPLLRCVAVLEISLHFALLCHYPIFQLFSCCFLIILQSLLLNSLPPPLFPWFNPHFLNLHSLSWQFYPP